MHGIYSIYGSGIKKPYLFATDIEINDDFILANNYKQSFIFAKDEKIVIREWRDNDYHIIWENGLK